MIANAVLNSLTGIITFLALFCVPGYLLYKASFRSKGLVEAVTCTLGLGIATVSLTSYTIAMVFGFIFRFFLSDLLVVISSLGLSLVGLIAIRRRHVRLLPDWNHEGNRTREQWIALALAALTFLLYLVHHDSLLFNEEDCVVRSAAMALDNRFPEIPEDLRGRNLTLFMSGGAREGSAALLAPFLALYEFFSFRFVHALSGALIALSGFLIGRFLFSFPGGGLLFMILLALNPLTLSIVVLDENMVLLALLSFALALAVKNSRFWLGALLGVALSNSHFFIVALPGFILLIGSILTHRKRWRRFSLGLFLFLLPSIFHHAAVLVGNGTIYESFEQFPPIPHHFFSWNFEIPAMLNFPFIDEIRRTPFIPFPTGMYCVLFLIKRLGVILMAFIPLGWIILARTNRRMLFGTLGWVIPIFLLLSVQLNWMETKKMGILFAVLPVFIIWIARGIHYLATERTWRRFGTFILLVALIRVGATESARLDFPVDERSYTIRPHVELWGEEVTLCSLREKPEYKMHELKWITRGNLLPDLSLMRHLFGGDQLRKKLKSFAHELARPSISQRTPGPTKRIQDMYPQGKVVKSLPAPIVTADRGSGDQETMPRPLVIDLTEPLIGGTDFISLGDEDQEAIAVGYQGSLSIHGLPVSWADVPGNLVICGSPPSGLLVVLLFGRPEDRVGLVGPDDRFLRLPDFKGQIAIRPPRDAVITFLEVTSFLPNKIYLWNVGVEQEGVRLLGPIRF